MSETILTIGGLCIIALTVAGIMWKRISPIVAMVLIPIVGALIMGFSTNDISKFFEAGLGKVQNVVVMFIFAIIFFGLISDAGIFTPIVRAMIILTRGNVTLVAVGTALIGMVAHLDGAGATTFLLTIPALLPLYKKLNMSIYLMLLILVLSASIMNMIPWGGPLGRAATVLNTPEDPVTAVDVYLPLIPVQIVGLILLVVFAALLGMRETRRIQRRVMAGEIQPQAVDVQGIARDFTEQQAEERAGIADKMRSGPWIYWANVVLVLLILASMLTGVFPPELAFMIGVAIALPLNFPTSSLQMERIRAHAPNALMMAAVILGAAVFLGILDKSGMLQAIAVSTINLLPEELGANLHLVIGTLGVPMDMVTSTDAYYYSVFPIVKDTVAGFGVPGMEAGHAMIIGNIIGTYVSPFAPSLWLALGLSGANMGKHIRYSFGIVWGFAVVLLVVALFVGIVSIR